MFEKKINQEYLKLAQIVYGGALYLELKKYKLKEVSFKNTKLKKVVDNLLEKSGIETFYSYKSEDSGLVANLFENTNNRELVIAFRGTERPGLGENVSNLPALLKDLMADLDLVAGNYNEQFVDAWKFYKEVKEQNPKRKIKLVGQSLGGALAQIVAAKEYTVNRKKVETYTFNAPGCKHLLDVYDCNTSYSYSFIYNYSVMNDWCGMFGEHIGQRYLIAPIKLQYIVDKPKMEILNSVLLTTHEGIFDYSLKTMGKVYRKPKDFNQQEGLALWYFDKNNPLKDYDDLADFLSFNPLPEDIRNNEFIQKTENFIKENIIEEVQNSDIAVAIKNATDSFVQVHNEQKEKFLDSLGDNTFSLAIKNFDSIMKELSQEHFEKANVIVSRLLKK